MRQLPAAAAVDLPKPHLAKETAAVGDGGGAAARRAAAPAGHLMQESAMDWATKPGVERMGIGMTSWRRGRVLGFYRAYRRTEEERRHGLLRSPRGSRQRGSRAWDDGVRRAQIKYSYEDARGQRGSLQFRWPRGQKNARAVCPFLRTSEHLNYSYSYSFKI
jgi:hypothetical protein